MYGLIGKKLGHSFSAGFFNEKFKKEEINEHYELFEISSISELNSLIENYPDLKGLNVTIPYKEEVIPLLTSVSAEAIKIGAVNVIKITREESRLYLAGFNTDAYGFRMSLLPLLSPEMTDALILGTGGASKAVEFVLKDLGIKTNFVSRTKQGDNLTYPELNEEIIGRNKLIVNTTPLGMFPETENCPDIPYRFLSSSHLCYDLIYNPEETLYLKKAKERGARVKNGLEMLHLQALTAWEIWND